MNASEIAACIAELCQYRDALKQVREVVAAQPGGVSVVAKIWRTVAESLKDGEKAVVLELEMLEKLQAAGVVR